MEEPNLQDPILVSWKAPEYAAYERGKVWYAIMIVIGLALLGVAFITYNFLFAVLIVMFGIIFSLQAMRRPEELDIIITNMGVLHGQRFVPFRDLRGFWVAYDPPLVKCVYLEFKRSMMPHLQILLDNQDPTQVREVLKRFVPENKEQSGETLMDSLSRLFKI